MVLIIKAFNHRRILNRCSSNVVNKTLTQDIAAMILTFINIQIIVSKLTSAVKMVIKTVVLKMDNSNI